jgi:hypothetical protein
MTDMIMIMEKMIRTHIKGQALRLTDVRSGQATLELTVALIFVMIFLVGAIRIFLWLNESIVNRQVDYEATRATAASTDFTPMDVSQIQDDDSKTEAELAIPGEVLVDESDKTRYPELNLFKSTW